MFIIYLHKRWDHFTFQYARLLWIYGSDLSTNIISALPQPYITTILKLYSTTIALQFYNTNTAL